MTKYLFLLLFILPFSAHAAVIVYTSPQGTLMPNVDPWSNWTFGGTDAAIYYNIAYAGSGGNTIPDFFYTGQNDAMETNFPAIVGSTTVSGQFCISSGAPCSPDVPFTYDGVAHAITSVNGISFADTSTRITSVTPHNNDIVATSTAFTITADGVVSSSDAENSGPGEGNTGLSVLWGISPLFNTCNDVLCAFQSFNSTYRDFPVIVGTSTQPWTVSTTTPGYEQPGVYRITAQLQKPKSFLGITNVFGLYLGYDTLAQRTETFVIGTTSALDTFILNNASAPGALASTSPNVCIPIPGFFNASDCVKMLFIPDQIPNYAQNWNAIQNKPPFGYFTAVSSFMKQATTTTATTTASGLTLLGFVFTPFRFFFTLLLWLLLALWLFKRVSHLAI